MQSKTLLTQTKDLFLDIFFPKVCVGCGLEGVYLCFDCAGRIERIQTPTCPECGRINRYGEFCQNCKRRLNLSLDGLIVSARYDQGPTKEMIHELKYGGLAELAPMLGELICQRLRYKLPRGDLLWVVPVPLHPRKEKERGFNQAELLARYLSNELELHGSLALERTRYTDPQAKLSGTKRRTNITDAFRIADAESIEGKTILLVDDVATTLSTLNECAKVLKEAGAKKVWGVVVARG